MAKTRPSVADKRRTFGRLHEAGCFAIPNPWDIGSALYLQSLGFKALATTSSGFAWSQGRADGRVARERVLAHLGELVAATDVPLNADFENGFAADSPGGLSMQQIAALGVRRVSVGGALARAAWGGFMRASRQIAEQGIFDGLAGAASGEELDARFSEERSGDQEPV